MSVTVRTATAGDAEALFGLNELFNGAGCSTVEHIREYLRSNEREIVFIAFAQQVPVGFCCVQVFKSMCYSVDYAEITELFVSRGHRNAGVGKALLQAAQTYFESWNLGGFQLFTGQENVNAQEFYRHMDFVSTDEKMYRKRRLS